MQSSRFAAFDRRIARAPDAARVAFLLSHDVAHRGLWDERIPENSLAAARAAIAGNFAIECDVRLSRDGVVFVVHDADTDRLTGMTGRIGELYAEQIDALRLSNSDQPIPRLSHFLALVSGRVPVILELKTDQVHEGAPLSIAVHAAIKRYRGPLAVMSFNPEVSRWFAFRAPEIVRGLTMTEHPGQRWRDPLLRRLAVWRARPDFLAYDVRHLPSALPHVLRSSGVPVLTWTVRSEMDRATAKAFADRPIFECQG